MRWSFILVALASCASPAIGSYPDDDIDLPQRRSSDDGDEESKSVDADAQTSRLTLTLAGDGDVTVTSSPAGLTCTGKTCSGSFPSDANVTLTATVAAGHVFVGWTGSCSGSSPTCTTKASGALTIVAEAIAMAGTWKGTYTNKRPAHGCRFENGGDLTVTVTGTTSLATAASMTGLEIRSTRGCAVVDRRNGQAPASPLTVGAELTGTWQTKVDGIGGSLDFPFEATLSGKTLTGSWTCTSCEGSFTLTKQ